MSIITEINFIGDSDETPYLKAASIDLHDHLTEAADWDAPFWDLEVEYLLEFSEKFEALFKQSANGLTFQALWVGDKPIKTMEVSLDAFLDIIRINQIGTRTKYFVRKGR